MATIKEQFEQNTADITLGRELLKELSDREGVYVWEKFEPSKTVAVTFDIVGTEPVQLKVMVENEDGTDSNIDLSQVTSEFFVGMTGYYYHLDTTPYPFEFTSPSTVTMNGNSNTFTYAPETQIITINVNNSYLDGLDYILKETEPIFISYVVSDDSSAYPDGAEQDGYWYEKVVESGYGSVDLLTPTGYTKMAIDKITFSVDTYNNTVYLDHSLGEKPLCAILLSPVRTARSGGYIVYGIVATTSNASKDTLALMTFDSPYGVMGGSIKSMLLDSKVMFYYSGTAKLYEAGVEYTLITMA